MRLFDILLTRRTSSGGTAAAPRRSGLGVLDADRTHINLYIFETLDAFSVPSAADFTLDNSLVATSKTITGVSISADTLTLTVSSPFVPNDFARLSYTPGTNPIRGTANNNLPAFSSVAIYIAIPPRAELGVISTFGPDSTTILASGGGGYVALSSSGDPQAFYAFLRVSGKPTVPSKMVYDDAATVSEGWAECQVTDSNAAIRRIGISGGNDIAGGNSPAFQIRIASGVAQAYAHDTLVGSSHTFASPSSSCRVRLKRAIPSFAVTFDYSTDGGDTWTTQYTFAATEAGQPQAYIHSNSTTVAIVGAALENFWGGF